MGNVSGCHGPVQVAVKGGTQGFLLPDDGDGNVQTAAKTPLQGERRGERIQPPEEGGKALRRLQAGCKKNPQHLLTLSATLFSTLPPNPKLLCPLLSFAPFPYKFWVGLQ